MIHNLKKPYVILIGSDPRPESSKIAMGLAHFAAADCVGYCGVDPTLSLPGLPLLSLTEARDKGAQSLVIGSLAANRHQTIEPSWCPLLSEAMQVGLDLINGHHGSLADVALATGKTLGQVARECGVTLHQLRQTTDTITIGTGKQRSGYRVLTVGTDCSSGKMTTALYLHRYLLANGQPSRFKATGQTGILITGSGVAVDTIPADFLAGVVENLCPEAPDITIIEGQGSLFHPAYAGVSLGLLHGAQASHLIMCHTPTKTQMSASCYTLPDLDDCMALTLTCGQRTAPTQRYCGIALNTAQLPEQAARDLIHELSMTHRLPVTDPHRFGIEPIATHLLVSCH